MSEEIKLETPGFDARFPNVNQTKRCWQNYYDYTKCVELKGEEYAPCKQFFKTYKSLCPDEWIERWDTLKDDGKLPFNTEA